MSSHLNVPRMKPDLSVLSRAIVALTVIGALAITAVTAAPYGPAGLPTEFTQPDGTQLKLRVFGDEFHGRTETTEGYTVVFDPATKTYYYAVRSADGSQLLPTATPAAPGQPAIPGLVPHLDLAPAAARAAALARFQTWDQDTGTSQRWTELKNFRQAVDRAAAEDGPQPAPPSFTTTGNKIGLTLLIDFSDDPATIPQANIIDFCNGDNYTGYGNNGSVKAYYRDNSNNLLTYTNTVTAYLRMAQPKSFYNNTSIDSGVQGRLLINDAIDIMKALPNYATEILPTFDTLTVDGSNRVVACNVFYAGGNGGVWSYGLWPHSWSLASTKELSGGGKKVSKYQITNIGSSLTLGTFCHENGHMLCGYPDIYDYDYDSVGGAGGFCLMNSGGHGTNPVLICAYLKRAAGWTTTTDLTSASSFTGTLVATVGDVDYNKIFRYPKPGTATEYFLFENRRKTGRDANIAASGIAIWHIDELGNKNNQSMLPNTSHANYEVTLVQADNLWHFQSDTNSGDSKDLYYLGNTAAAYTNTFNDNSAPHAHWWSGAASGLNVSNISAAGTTMTLQFGLPANTVVVTSPNGGETLFQNTTHSITWNATITGNVKIELLKTGAFHSVIAANEANDGAYSWSPAGSLPVGNDYTIRVSSVDTPAYADTSNATFIITTNIPHIPWSATNWRYLHNNTDQGTAWRAKTFNDSSWTTGTAELGYGDGDEATAITRPTPRYATGYFRKHFTVANPAQTASLALQVEYDDAYAVYLNGTRIAGNLPTDPAFDYFTDDAIEDTIAATANVPTSLLVAGDNVIAVEIHQATSTSSDLSMNLSLTGAAASGPEIVIEQPAGSELTDGAASVAFGDIKLGNSGAPVTFTVRNTGITDLTGLALTKDGTHSADFAIGNLAGTTLAPGASATFTVTFTPGAAGARTAALHLASNDPDENPFDINLTGTGIATILVPAHAGIPGKGAIWKYLVSATAPAATWRTASFNDAAWPQGAVECGYGDGDEITDTGYTGSSSSKNLTTYFRHSFVVANPASVGTLTLRLRRDDGAVVYLNGQEVFRSNLPAGTITHTTPASAAADDDGETWFSQTLTPTQSVLQSGINGVAVEIHNSSGTSSDISFDFELTGVEIAVPEIAVEQPAGTGLTDGTAVLDCGSLNLGAAPATFTVTVKNPGTADLTGLALTVDGPDHADFTVSGLGATTLAPNETTTFTVSFAPGAAGTRTAALHLASNDADENPFDIALTGTGIAVPEIAVEQPAGTDLTSYTASLDCGSLNLGAAPATFTVTVKNPGTADLTGLALTVNGPNHADFTVGSLGATTLASNETTTFTVSFAPGAAGTRTAALHLASNDADENPFDIAITGIGVAVPEIAVEQPAGTGLTDGAAVLDCGSLNLGVAPATFTVTVKNPGTADLTDLALTVDGPDHTDFTAGSLGATTLAPNETTTFTVSFAPGAAGTRTAALHLASNDADEDPFDIALTGTGRVPVESWRLANFGISESTGTAANDADPDGDGLSNLIEYGFGMNPNVPDNHQLTCQKSGDSLALVYPRNLAATDLMFVIEGSSDLGVAVPWLTVAVDEEILGTTAGIQQVKATLVFPPEAPGVFLRVRMSLDKRRLLLSFLLSFGPRWSPTGGITTMKSVSMAALSR